MNVANGCNVIDVVVGTCVILPFAFRQPQTNNKLIRLKALAIKFNVKLMCHFLNVDQSVPLLIYFLLFLIAISTIQIGNSIYGVLGIRTGPAGW